MLTDLDNKLEGKIFLIKTLTKMLTDLQNKLEGKSFLIKT